MTGKGRLEWREKGESEVELEQDVTDSEWPMERSSLEEVLSSHKGAEMAEGLREQVASNFVCVFLLPKTRISDTPPVLHLAHSLSPPPSTYIYLSHSSHPIFSFSRLIAHLPTNNARCCQHMLHS